MAQIIDGRVVAERVYVDLRQRIAALRSGGDADPEIHYLSPVLEPDGTLPEAMSPTVFASRIKSELGQWKQIATDHKIVAE